MQTVPAKTIVTRCKSTGWFGYAYNMNIYRGCCHGCIYCDSRSDCYRIDDFDTVRAKENALAVIRDDLRRKVRTGVVGTGAMSDPYNPFEAGELLTRHALELLNAFGFGVGIATKSDLILRDIDILQEIRTQSPVIAKLTVTTPCRLGAPERRAVYLSGLWRHAAAEPAAVVLQPARRAFPRAEREIPAPLRRRLPLYHPQRAPRLGGVHRALRPIRHPV